MSRSPNYRLRNQVYISVRGDRVELPSGAFIRPIEVIYVPKHVTERLENKFFNVEVETYCFTRYGIVAIPKSAIAEA